jgi:hypothetical protein
MSKIKRSLNFMSHISMDENKSQGHVPSSSLILGILDFASFPSSIEKEKMFYIEDIFYVLEEISQ